MEGSSLARDAGGFNAAAVLGEDGADDGQAHAGAFAGGGAALAAEKLFKDEWEVVGVDSGAVVLNRELKTAVCAAAGEADARGGRGVAAGVFEEMTEDAAEEMGVEPDGLG